MLSRQIRKGLAQGVPAGLAALGLMLLTSGCSKPEDDSAAQTADPMLQGAYRVRTDFAAPLNADSGWAGRLNEPASVMADSPFRLRLEVEHAAGAERAGPYSLQVRRNRGTWEPLLAENFPQPAKEEKLKFEKQAEDTPGTAWEWIEGDASALRWEDAAGDGYLSFKTDTAPVLALGQYHTHWEPVEFAADVRLPSETSRGGLVFGFRDQHNYHRVDLEPGRGLYLVQVEDGLESILATHEFAVQADRWAELKVILRGPEITVEYDDEALVFTERLSRAVASPKIGVFVPGGGALDLHPIAIEGMPRSPRTSIVEAAAFAHGEATQDLLAGSPRTFDGGAAVSFARETPSKPVAGGHTEWEFPLVIRRFADGAAMNEHGDQFEYRLIDNKGEPLPASNYPEVTLEVPVGHMGGTFVETPARIGPWEAGNGDYYFLMEPSETDNMLMTVKSSDGGASWAEVDGANRPATGDLEGFASVLEGSRIHMLHQTSNHVFYHVFRTSDHAEQPDTWAIRDERLASPVEPPTQVADIAVLGDGSVVAVYGGPQKIHYRIRSPEGRWSEESVIDADREPSLSGPMLVRSADDVVHLAYTGSDGTAWYRQLHPNGELTPRLQFAEGLGTDSEDVGSILPLVYLPESGAISIIYRLAEGQLWERRVDSDSELSAPVQVTRRNVVQNAVDADQTGADAIAYGDSVQVLFIEADTGSLYSTNRRPGQGWAEAELQVEGVNVQWVRGALLRSPSERPVYGYVYDAGSYGGSGMNKYAEVPLPAPQ